MKLAELHWPEVQKLNREKIVAVVPVGSMEQHGPHLPFQVDVLVSSRLAKENPGDLACAAHLDRGFGAPHGLSGLHHLAR